MDGPTLFNAAIRIWGGEKHEVAHEVEIEPECTTH